LGGGGGRRRRKEEEGAACCRALAMHLQSKPLRRTGTPANQFALRRHIYIDRQIDRYIDR
jgi:hypothetical protein